MTQQFAHRLTFVILLICQSSICLATEIPDQNDSTKYLNAVRTFADNVLKYGRDTYGPKHTPLFVDGLNVNTHEPVKWISPEGDVLEINKPVATKEWILSNFASQQTLLRTLHGLSEITGDPKYRDAAMLAIKYAFENLRFNNGLFYWGHVAAYDALADEVWGNSHSFKTHYPHYELMWQVNPEETRRFIETYWSAHVIDWSNLDFNRIGDTSETLEEPWDHEYEGGPTFFKSKISWAGGFFTTGTSLAHAGTTLSRLSGQGQPLVWSKRLIKRFVETRHPKTGISAYQYNQPLRKITGDDIEEHFTDPRTFIFPFYPWDSELYHGENVQPLQWISVLLVGDALGDQGKEFIQWATQEFTAWAKASYRKSDNVFIPILTDATNLDGYVFKEDCELGFKDTVLKPLFADLRYFWAYSIGYRMTGDKFMWQMARDISSGNNLGDIGQDQGQESELKMDTACSDVYGLMGFLELYSYTGKSEFLAMARRIADNILDTQFHSGLFVLSKKHIYSRLDCFESLVLLHLVAAIESKPRSVPRLWPSCPLFVPPYRFKQIGDYPRIIYRLTGSPEVPISLQEAAAIGDINAVRSLLEDGINVDSIDDSFGKTALHRAAISGHKNIVKLLIDAGARLDAKTGGSTALHYTAERGHTRIAELLIAGGADINAKDRQGQTPVDIAASRNRKDIVQLLLAKGATISSIHVAAQMGDLAGVKALLKQGADVNAKDDKGMAPLNYSVQEGHKELVEFLIAKEADVNSKDKNDYTPLYYAIWYENKDIIKLLVAKGADVNHKPEKDYPPLHYAIWNEDVELVKLLVNHGAKFNVKDLDGWTAFRYVVSNGDRELLEFFIAKGANASDFHMTVWLGDLNQVKRLVKQGTDVNTEDKELKWTPLHWAAFTGPQDVVEFLIAKGANANAKDEFNSTPLQYVAVNGHKESAELLIAKGADVNATDNWGSTPLNAAARKGHQAVVELLIAKGATVNAKDRNDRTPLYRAAMAGHRDVVEILVANGANIDAKDKSDRTALHMAVMRDRNDVAALLIAKGADINSRNANGQTPLHLSASQGQRDTVELLITKGADVNARNKWNRTPLDIAVDRGHREIVELLRKHMLSHDVALTNVSVPFTCAQGDIVPIMVSIANEGDQREAFRVILVDAVSNEQIAGREMTLEPQRYKSAKAADLVLSPTSSGKGNFGWGFNIHGDVNRDGCEDLLVGAGWWNGNQGRAYLYFGGADMDGTPDLIFAGEASGDFLGDGGAALGDVNGDGYDDVIIGARGYNNNDGRLYIFFGGVDMDKEADIILDGEPGKTGYFSCNCLSVGDIDKDGYVDVLVGACGYDNGRGRAYLFYGGDPMDCSADVIFEGEHADDTFGRNATIGQDVDGDGYRDILIGARRAPEGTRNGRAYLFYGGDRNQIDDVSDMTFAPPVDRPHEFGSSLDIYEIDNDGYADVVIGARLGQGAVFIYWGNKRDKMDSVADVIILGENGAQSSLGGDKLFCADFNRDGYGDIAVGAYNWLRQNRIGRTYIYYGDTKTSIDTQPDMILSGETEVSWFGHDIGGGDFNNDGYTDLVAGAWGYNNDEGRAYMFYSPFEDKTDITFNWDTTNASIGEHTLKVEIPPVPGEQNTEDNVKTVTIEVKEPSK